MDGGRITHAQLSIGNADVMLGASGAEFRPPDREEVGQYVLVRVEDVEQHFEQAKRFGVRIVHPPTDMPLGERVCTVQDLAGHRRAFSHKLGRRPMRRVHAVQSKLQR